MEESVHTSLPPELPLDKSLEENLRRLKQFTGGSSDVIIKDGMLSGCRIAVITCEGMADTDTLAQLIYNNLKDVGEERLPPEEVIARLFEKYLIAAEQLEIKNLGDLTLKLQSGFAIVLADGCYFYSLSIEGAMLSIISLVRRFSVVVTFVLGALLFKEQNIRAKAIDLLILLSGIAILVFSS